MKTDTGEADGTMVQQARPCRRRVRYPTTVAQRPGQSGANSSRLHPIDLYDNSGTTYRQIAVLRRHGIEHVSPEPPEWAYSLLERIDNMPWAATRRERDDHEQGVVEP